MIRDAKIEDFEILSQLEKCISKDMLKRKIENSEILIVIEDGKIIGWLRYNLFWDTHPFMNMLFVLEPHRGKGYGKKLVLEWEERMKEKNYELLMLSTMADEYSQHFYRKLDYRDAGSFILPSESLEIILVKEL